MVPSRFMDPKTLLLQYLRERPRTIRELAILTGVQTSVLQGFLIDLMREGHDLSTSGTPARYWIGANLNLG